MVADARGLSPSSDARGTVPGTTAVEGHEHEPEHVGGRQHRRQDANHPQRRVAGRVRLAEDLVLAEEAREARDAGNRHGADQEGPVGDRQVFLEAAHLPEVLLAVQRVNHRAAAEEEQRLEEGVRVEMEDAGAERADAHRQEHVAELRHRRVRQHALDVVLHQADRAGKQRRRRADDRHDLQRLGRVREQHGVAADHVDARRHHRRRVDQGGDRRRALHRVRQPHVERNLRGLARGADEEQQRRHRHHAPARLGWQHRRLRRDLLEVERAEVREDQQRAEDEREVADAVDDEGLLAGVGGRLLLVPEADQQVGAEADAFPAHEEHREVRPQHQHQHERGEQVQVREVPRVFAVGLLVHVRGRVDVNQRADAGDDENHHGRQRVDAERGADVQVARRDPREHGLFDRVIRRPAHRQHGGHRDGEGGQHREAGHAAGDGLRQPLPEESVDQEPGERQQRYQREHGSSSPLTTSGW